MSKRYYGLLALLVASFMMVPAMAQRSFADIIGKVVAENSDPVPGATVVAESPALQGSRTAVSNEDGAFLLRFLPPGEYVVTVTMPGMETQKQKLTLTVGGTARPTFTLGLQTQTEALVVTAQANTILDTSQVTSNLKEEFINNLPVRRNVQNLVVLTPGVTTSGPRGRPVISGAMSFENNYLLNGGVINSDNVRGAPSTLYVEDAIEETTVITGSVSAEYGQFTGGVINTITKQGGNEFSGSVRVSFENEDWESLTPIEEANNVEKDDDISNFQTVTVGGPIIKDRLWFFLAGRREREKGTATIAAGTPLSTDILNELGLADSGNVPGNRTVPNDQPEDRYEVKLTFTPVENHSIIASYLDKDFAETNDTQFGVLSQSAIISARAIPESLLTFNYRGIITPAFSIEAFYSERKLAFERELSVGTDRISGATSEDSNTQGGLNYGSPFFGAKPETRDNELYWIKGSYFLNTSSAGTHDFVFGYSNFADSRKADNEQSPSGFRNFPSATRFDANGNPIAIYVDGFESPNSLFSGVSFWPVLNPSQGSDFTVESLYFNDVWQLNEKWRFNIGVRYDKNDAFSQDGAPVADDAKLSPRLSATYDIFGDGRHVVNAGYGEYVARLSSAGDSATSAGSPAIIYYYYQGPQTESLADVYAWMESTYGANWLDIDFASANADFVRVPGQTKVIRDTLDSPSADEIQIGYSTRFGSKGFMKVNYINREFNDFYTGLTNLDIGRTDSGADLEVLTNDPGFYERDYDGIQIQGQYKFNDDLMVGGNYTWSQLTGNIVGETGGSGSITSTSLGRYPEFNNYPNREPVGNILGDIRNTANLWLSYDLNTAVGDFNFTMLQRYRSGEHYSATGSVSVNDAYGFPSRADSGYASPPRTNTYYFSPRGGFETEEDIRTDLGVNYTINWKRFEFFVEVEILNLLNSDNIIDSENINTSVLVQQPFNVYTETPVEGVNYRLGDSFGEATDRDAYQTPRTFRFDLGFRF